MRRPISNHLVIFFITTPPGLRGEAAHYNLFMKIGFWIACVFHTSWALVFALNRLPGLSMYNIVVAVAFATAALIWRKLDNPLWLLILLWFTEVPFHAFLGTLYTGLATFFWAVLVASAASCLITHQLSWAARLAWSAAVLGASLGMCVMTFFAAPLAPLGTGTQIYFMVTSFVAVMGGIIAYLAINQFHVLNVKTKLSRERDRSETLLRNILPAAIAAHLKNNPDIITDKHPEVTALFADIVNFTTASAKLPAAALVTALNAVYSRFDDLVAKHGVEKIKTIGDTYTVVAGMPEARANHADAMVALALDMVDAARGILMTQATRCPLNVPQPLMLNAMSKAKAR